MSYIDYDDDAANVAQSCKYMSPRASSTAGRTHSGEVSCSICSNWVGNCCRRKVFDNMLSSPDID